MTDLINKIDKIIKDDINSIQVLITKYSSVLQDIRIEKNIQYLAYIFNISINHINKTHQDISKDWKAWSVIVIKNLYLKGKIKKEEDIIIIINNFAKHYIAEYENYCENVISTTNYDRDYGFVLNYVNKK